MTALMINIDVDDLAKVIAFYEAALGLRAGKRYTFGVELRAGPAPIYLLKSGAECRPYL
jgi:catechol 2,3-dioxygenase-like lactoylglutathione lyase family enzyme